MSDSKNMVCLLTSESLHALIDVDLAGLQGFTKGEILEKQQKRCFKGRLTLCIA